MTTMLYVIFVFSTVFAV